ncbi:response regulator transcription factor [Roseateles toxinivorans]|uniref:Two-component system response regulator QseB/two-component system response regulator BasR n=1 Tax=Roseateles toxinivorans TaxID=270368 RepID=A0A4R6QR85_9BURK|nr:response regulator transcription factor [Roseateles toxinivorans]TDP73273.1 two-component system response regulator QseB/two-component system response regulator BasR [Roseateles toxinivorans]
MKICMVEDDLELGRSLQVLLQEEGNEVMWVRRATDARYWTAEREFNALLLDLGLPDGDGIELLRSIRLIDKKLPIVVITARDGIEDRLTGLNSGADDYLVKPFAGVELLARLRAVARRSGQQTEDEVQHTWHIKDLELDEHSMTLKRAGSRITLSRTEFSILLALLRLPDRVVTRRQLEAKALVHADGRSLDVHISNIRKKIGEGYIRTVRGVGFLVERE